MFSLFLDQIRKIRHSGSFIRSVSITSFWNVLIIVVQFVLSPIVTRLYSPAEYGVFALISSIIVPITLVGSFKYSDAIVICETKQDRDSTVLLSLGLIAATSLLTFIVVLAGRDYILSYVGSAGLGNFILLIPVIICCSGIIEILLYLNVRNKKFSFNGFSGFAMNLSSRSFVIGYAFSMPAQAIGLIAGELFGKLTALLLLLGSIKSVGQKFIELIRSTSFSSLAYVARLYRRFPLYVMPANLINSFSGYLPIYFFKQQHFASSIIGAFALASSLLEIINRMLPYSVASIFFPKAVELKNKSMDELKSGVYKLYWMMLVASLVIFTGAALLAEIVFPFVFGDSWTAAGVFVSILCIQYAFNFVSLPISEVFKVIEKQRFLFVATILSIALKVMAIFIMVHYVADERQSIFWFSVTNAFGSIIPIVGIFYFLKFKLKQVVASLAATFVFLATVIVLINFK
ncbi:MAG: oligosaccharide flippase family protein [Cyclobacteriaceae bacterium]|nr:oligosaccharide flippase family protein [Cyclobacteriaceae bacterium]